MTDRDRCCGKCRTPFSVCALSRKCKCHRHPELNALETIPAATTEEEVW